MYFDGCKLNEISQIWRCLPHDSGQTPTYMNSEWFQFINDGGEGWHGWMIFASMFYSRFGEREIILPESILDENYDSYNDFLDRVKTYISVQLDFFYWLNNTKFGFYYNVLIDKTYNPIWNVDGTENRTITDTQKGYRENEKSIEGTIDENGGTVYKGSEANEHTGHDDLELTGKRDLEKSGEISNEKTGKEITANVPMETTTFFDTTRTEFENRKDTESYTDYKESETFTNRKDKQSYFSKETKTFTERKDEISKSTSYDNYKENTKDKVSNDYEVKRVDSLIRQGNIGVTKSQDLVSSELELRAKNDLLNMIMSDMAQYLLYMC